MKNCEHISRTNYVNYRCFHYYLSQISNIRLVIQLTYMNVHVDLYMHLHAQRTLRVDDVLVLRFHLLLELHNNELRTYFADQLRKLSLCALSQSLVECATSNSIHTHERVSSSSFSSSSLRNVRCAWMFSSRCDFINFSLMNCERILRTNNVNSRCFHYYLNHTYVECSICNSIHVPERSRRSSHAPSFSSTTHANLV
jgi:hypothetical protein